MTIELHDEDISEFKEMMAVDLSVSPPGKSAVACAAEAFMTMVKRLNARAARKAEEDTPHISIERRVIAAAIAYGSAGCATPDEKRALETLQMEACALTRAKAKDVGRNPKLVGEILWINVAADGAVLTDWVPAGFARGGSGWVATQFTRRVWR